VSLVGTDPMIRRIDCGAARPFGRSLPFHALATQPFGKTPMMKRHTIRTRFACVAATAALLGSLAAKADDTADTAKALRTKGVNFLKTTQADDGSWTQSTQVGVSGLVVYSLLQSGLKPDDPAVAKGLKFLEGFVQKDGGIYHEKTAHKNYETCITLMAFAKANGDGKYKTVIANAEKFLKELQWDEGESQSPGDVNYGGAGYGNSKRPDLSNTTFLIEALKAAGTKEDDPAMKKALVFVSRTQNLETEFNTTPFAAKVNDGGFYYTPAAGGSSQAGAAENGGLRSYGSMTYAGLKSMIYAGLKKDDPRVKAAVEWIGKHYTLDENPVLGQQGLFYYYHTFARSLTVIGVDEFTEADGTKHDWRKELVAQLAKRQGENGAWVNRAERWFEGDPNLATAYALMALSYCEKAK